MYIRRYAHLCVCVCVHTYLTWTGLELNPVLCGARRTNNCLSHGVALKTDKNKHSMTFWDDLRHLQGSAFLP